MTIEPDELGTHRFSDRLRQQFPDEVGTFDEFEAQVETWQALFVRARNMAHYEEARFRASGLITARRQIGHLAAPTSIRLVDLASGLVLLLNEGHAHPAYAVARAIVETAAVPAYALRNVVPLVAKKRGERAAETLRRLVMGLDPGVAAAFTEATWDAEGGAHPVRISKLIDALCAEAEETHGEISGESAGSALRAFYSNLSDHTHPNTSAVHLSATLTEDGMRWARPAQLTHTVFIDVLGTSSLALWYGERAMDALLKAANKHPLVLDDKRRGL